MLKKIALISAIIFLAGSGCQKAEKQNAEIPPAPIEKNITIISPKANETVSFPFVVKGEARVFENQFNIRIKSYDGAILYEDIVMANAPDMGQFGPYEKNIDYLLKQPENNNLILEVLDYSAKDGSEQDLVSVPIKINFSETRKVKIFLGSSKLDPEASCNKVFAVERIIPKTQTPSIATINVLLKGQSAEEKNTGYFTSINADVKLQKLTIENGTAKADFDEQLEASVGGSCRVSAIRAQITETLKQFPSVKDVIISINGRTEDILQP